eukprot:TRINITY_DN917_c0_g2_i1.p1 TRINITY_DN917_c0_g2~~TRINITY_DN917_c0_g2_i1.p1  ORF type:complete len:290 (-),score=51.23 TRINITY_DN917_c0_g2_i1:240-1034(-)
MAMLRSAVVGAASVGTAFLLTGCGETDEASTTTTTTLPTEPTTTTTTTTVSLPAACLCIFDIDRTLTAIQPEMLRKGKRDPCKSVAHLQKGIKDGAYSGGTLRLSDLAAKLDDTHCADCYRGVVTAGEASGPASPERALLLELLGGVNKTLSDHWADVAPFDDIQSLVLGYPDEKKVAATDKIVEFFRNKTQGVVTFPDENVWFFDDRRDNIMPFMSRGYNAIQVSCETRDAAQGEIVGLCGASADEVQSAKKGVHACPTTVTV